ncbi:MAG: hypothetical protein A2508_08115 [Candidatus Lambdaproteobacteria bacterium RIFOXYD12_FULL_49_8]|uniref:Porin domain-containing protein n=1 Tax=Candidatus Lambdaproteobacteria bacterium RIFOXYD2_FULL_50_16 TaxID=1817772 RepID=A0A1F6GFP6_9PROT|nr:MAG: hypothetical protein A2527_00180 [Candidatus Lambdaproteobacteria bacterium RIFOXYD2_FULL_50_16]OGG97882.1 MAG: hypothetical protein A2508_08115 [Candidatus Lambdaproteobacteria bacterium RIFOXYD12_FULL_49_8]
MSAKFFKSALLASAALILASAAYAEGEEASDYEFKVTGKIRSYFGQYTTGATGYSGHMTEFNEGNIAGEVKRGGMKGYYEIESREDNVAPITIRQITYTWENGLTLGVGTFKPKWGYSFSADAFTDTSESAHYGFYKGETTKLEGDGLDLEYKFGDHKVGVNLYEDDRINKTKGSTTQVGAQGKIAGIGYRIGSISALTDDHQGGETAASSAAHLGVEYKADSFFVTLDSASKTKGTPKTTNATTGITTAAYETKYTDAALQVGVDVGDDQVVVTLAQESTGSVTDYAYTNLVYVMPVAKGADIRLLYSAASTTPASGTATTASFAGLGMVVKF